MDDSSEDDIYINEGYIKGPKPQISDEQKKELLQKGKDSTCKISIPDVNKGNGYFCKIFYNGKKYNVLILNHKIIMKEELKNHSHFKIRYEKKNYNVLILNQKIIKKEQLKKLKDL